MENEAWEDFQKKQQPSDDPAFWQMTKGPTNDANGEWLLGYDNPKEGTLTYWGTNYHTARLYLGSNGLHTGDRIEVKCGDVWIRGRCEWLVKLAGHDRTGWVLWCPDQVQILLQPGMYVRLVNDEE